MTKLIGFASLLLLLCAQIFGPTRVIADSAVTLANTGIDVYEYIAQKIEPGSDEKSCTLTYSGDASDDGVFEGYAFNATVTGSKCGDATAVYGEVLGRVQQCADALHDAHAVRGCCHFSYKRKWHGHLKLTVDPDNFPPIC